MLTPTSWQEENDGNSGGGSALNIMRLIYLDEAGKAAQSQEPVFVRAAIVITGDKQWQAIENDFDKIIAAKIPKQHQLDYELHAHELFSTEGREKYGSKETRWDILAAFLGLFKKHEIPILWGAVDKAELAKRAGLVYLNRKFGLISGTSA
jgi:hypothetical protein